MYYFDKIELLAVELLENSPQNLTFIDRMKKALSLELGWHYVLDLLWILEHIKHLRKGSTILDAGAGMGLLQFLLATEGYNVISVDYSQRTIPKHLKPIFAMRYHAADMPFHDAYSEWTKKAAQKNTARNKLVAASKLLNIQYLTLLIKSFPATSAKFGNIAMYQADVKNMDFLQEATVDAVVSLSVIEHIVYEDIHKAIGEFLRVAKHHSPVIITTSASRDKDWFHEPSGGWCFSEPTLKRIMGMKGDTRSNWAEYDTLFSGLKNSGKMKARLSPMYFRSGANGMPWGIWDPKYQPVGILKIKE